MLKSRPAADPISDAAGPTSQLTWCWKLLGVCCLGGLLVAVPRASGAEPPPLSPQVRQAIDRGLDFLSNNPTLDDRLGARVLAARAMLYAARPDAPEIPAALTAIDRELASSAMRPDIYSAGLVLLLLTELDPNEHRERIDRFVAYLLRAQKQNGAWGYDGRPTGDTSMTQYALLGLWVAERSGSQVPSEVWENAANWLLRTQTPSGAWGYQGKDTGRFERVEQLDVTPTMALAGLGSLYLCGDRLGLIELEPPRQTEPSPVLRRVVADTDSRPRSEAVDADWFRQCVSLAETWRGANRRTLPPRWHSYFFYTLERFESVHEALDRSRVASQVWYKEASDFLLDKQLPNGSWAGDEGPVPATGFVVLMLMRSMQHTLATPPGLGAGTLIGGRGLPSASGDVTLHLGKVVAQPTADSTAKLLATLDQPRSPEFARALDVLELLAAEGRHEELTAHSAELVRLAGSRSAAARAAALGALSSTRDLDHVPLLIASLEDTDDSVSAAAREALYRLSRRVPPEPMSAAVDASAKAVEAEQWRRWYLQIRPQAESGRDLRSGTDRDLRSGSR